MQIRKKEFWKYVILGIIGMVGSSLTILTDAYFVADRLGPNGLAAMNLTMSMFGLMNGTGLLFGVGGATLYTIRKAKGLYIEANHCFVLSFFSTIFLGLIYALIGLLYSKNIAYILGANYETIEMSTIYLKTILLFAPFFSINHLLMVFIRNDGNPNLAMKVMMIGSISNIILDYLFMYPFNMGLLGAALATGIASLISISISSSYLFSNKCQISFIKTKFKFNELTKIISLGLSTFIGELSSSIVLILFNLLILNIAGNPGVASYGIIANLAWMVLSIMSGISHGLQPLFSQEYSEGHLIKAKHLYLKGVVFTFILGASIFILSYIFSPFLVQCFNNEANPIVQEIAEEGIKIYFIGFFFVGTNYLTTSYFSAIEKPQFLFIIVIFRGIFGIILSGIILSYFFKMVGIWLSFPIIELITILFCFILHKSQKII